MNVPIRISQLTQFSPVLSGDQLLVARGSGATGESGRVLAKHLVCDMISASSTSTLNLSFDKISGVLKGEVTAVPSNAGGTGILSYLPGQILIGTSTGSVAANFLTAGPRIGITNSSGSITLTPSATNLSIMYNLSSADIIPSTGSQATLSAATNATAGLMTNADRVKLDGIDVNANNYVHPAYVWTNANLTNNTVIDNLTVNSTGHLTGWSTRTLGTIVTQNANAVNIAGGTVEATNEIKSFNSGKTTMYASIGPDATSSAGVLKLADPGGTSRTIAASSVTFSGAVGTKSGITLNNSPLCLQQDCFVKGAVYAEGGLYFYNSGTGAWNIATSDARAKEIISDYNQGLNEVVKLNPIKFKFKNNIEPFLGDNERIGLIAQDVESVFPQCVYQLKQKLDGKEQDVYQLDTSSLTFAFINAFKDLNTKYEILEKKYEDLSNIVKNNK